MKLRLKVLGESHAHITERAEELAQQFAGDQPYVVKYAPGYAEEVDQRQGARYTPPRAADLKLIFVVPITIEVGDEPEAIEEDDE